MRRLLVYAFLCLLAVPALAGPHWDNGTALTRLVSGYYHADPVVVISVGQDTHDLLDVLVTFELARMSGSNPLNIHKERLAGQHWTDIMARHSVAPESLLAGLTPLPHTLDHHRNGAVLYDQDVRELVGLRFVVGALGTPCASVVASRNNGVTYESMILGR